MLNHLKQWKDLGRIFEAVLLLLCVFAATALRFSFASNEPLWVDEAASSVNALSILEHGYPADRYLGLPIYENVLLRPSPDSKEYEFSNSNRSRSGITIEQGWLPLYSIAAAFAFARIRPDVDDGGAPSARHNAKDLRKRTTVPRLPSIFFAALFLISIYRLGRTISGNDAAWSVLIVVASAQPLVSSDWHAGDYSATLAMATVSGLAVWNLARRGTWRDSIVAGLALVLLFYTDRLSFMILSAVLLANARFAPARTPWRLRLLATGAFAALGIVPWLYWTDFLEAAARTPMAWPLLAFPGDFVSWFVTRRAFLGAIGLIVAVALLSGTFPRHRLAHRIIDAAGDLHAFYFTMIWFVVAYLAFIFLSPATNFVDTRLMLVLAVPGYLLFAQCAAVAARIVSPRFSIAMAPLAALAFLGLRGAAIFTRSSPPAVPGVEAFVEAASHWTLEPGTRIYAWPNENLL